MKTTSFVIGAVAIASAYSSPVTAQDVLVKRINEDEGATFVTQVDFTGGGTCTGEYTFTSVPAPVVQSSPHGECVADASGLSHKATCSGSSVSSYLTYETRNCGGTGEANADAKTCVADSSFASKSVCFQSEAGGLLAKGRLYTNLNLCKTGDYYDDSVEYWGQYVPPTHANKCMPASVDGYFVKHSCGTSDGHSFTTYYSDPECKTVTTPEVVMPGMVSTFGTCKELETGGAALVFEECVTFVSELGAAGHAELAGGLAAVSLFAAISLVLTFN
jgi:hypothetical protein